MDLAKPMPEPTPITQRFWDALRAHRIEIQRCRECRAWFFYPRAACPRCWSSDLEWAEISGRGRICSFTIARVPTAPHFRDESPQRIAIVELDEGPRLTTTIPGSAPAELRVGLRVRPSARTCGIEASRCCVMRSSASDGGGGRSAGRGDRARAHGRADRGPLERPFLLDSSKQVLRAGPLGAGTALELARNAVGFGLMAVIAEAIHRASAAGVDPGML